MPSSRPELAGLTLGGSAEPWERFGFTIRDGAIHVGGVKLSFGDGEGIVGWELGEPGDGDEHPNGIAAIDHVVLLTDDLDATVAELIADGFDHRVTRGPQAFFVVGPCLLEVVAAKERGLWGITFVAEDLERFGTPKDAVQPGRRIVTVREEVGLGFPVAIMTPR